MKNPRSYQRRILETAKTTNTIAVLRTGSGKTLIAAMLLEYFHEFGRLKEENKIMIFLAPTVPLVIQQSQYLHDNTSLKVKPMYGAMKIDSWIHEDFQEACRTHHVLVMSPAILVAAIQSTYIAFDQIELLVFDECHHARKSHPYAQLISLYRLYDSTHKPRIFGMTASPSNNQGYSCEYNIQVLESNLESIAVKNEAHEEEELNELASKPIERTLYYHTPPVSTCDGLQVLSSSGLSSIPFISKKIQRDAESLLLEGGPWMCDVYVSMVLQYLDSWCENRRLAYDLTIFGDIDAEDAKDLKVGAITMFLSAAKAKFSHLFKSFNLKSHKTDSIIGYEDQDFFRTDEWKPLVDYGLLPSVDLKSQSPKLISLVQYLVSQKQTSGFCGIIFVQKRIVCFLLHLLLAKLPELNFVRPCYLVGNAGRTMNNSGKTCPRLSCLADMKTRLQKATLHAFKTDRTNLLCATNVAEEGLDIQSCKLVIRYDLFQTLTNYIQSRGRARHPDSEYILMIDQADPVQANLIQKIRQEEKNMINYLESMTRDVRQLNESFLPQTENSPQVKNYTEEDIYRVTKTQAVCTIHSSVQKMYQFCDLLPKGEFIDHHPEIELHSIGDSGFFAEIRMSNIFPPHRRVFKGPATATKQLAVSRAALKVIQALHEYEYLDDYLKPVSQTNEDEVEDEKTTPTKEEYIRATPTSFSHAWSPEQLCHVYRMSSSLFDGDAEYVLVCPHPISEETVDYQSSTVSFIKHSSVIFTAHQLTLLHQFHTQLMQSQLKNSIFKNNPVWAYCFAPFSLEYQTVDLALLEAPCVDLLKEIAGLSVVDHCHKNRLFGVERVLDDLKADTPLTEELLVNLSNGHTFDFPLKNFQTVKDYYRYRLQCEQEIELDQPLILAVKATHKESKNRELVLLLPQFCSAFRSSANAVCYQSPHLPNLCMLLEHYLMCREFRDQLNLKAPDSLVRMAMTAKSSNLPNHLERLEFLGDSFLKLAMSLLVYSNHPDAFEGQLTVMCQKRVNNNWLFKKGLELEIPRYLLTKAFDRKTFLPCMVNGIDKHTLAQKRIADCVEAIIGSQLAEQGFSTVGVCANWIYENIAQDTTNYLTIEQTLTQPKVNRHITNLKKIHDLEQRIGYTFKNSQLALHAINHPSALNDVECYQRLEFLGDAVLSYLITQRIYHQYPLHPPASLSEYRSEIGGNRFLGMVSFALGLPKYLNLGSENLAAQLRVSAREMELQLEKFHSGEKTAFWRKMMEAPKSAADMIESLLGAIFLDCGMNFELLSKLVDRWIFEPWQSILGEPSKESNNSLALFYQSMAQYEDWDMKFNELIDGVMEVVISIHGKVVFTKKGRAKSELRWDSARSVVNLLNNGQVICP